MKYYIRTAGCQMNESDSQRVGSELEKLGYHATADPEAADVIVLNTCVVRQSAEDKAYGWLTTLSPLKKAYPDKVVNLMGCLVGVKGNANLVAAFPFVDVFSPPSDPGPLVHFLRGRNGHGDREAYDYEAAALATRYAAQDGDLVLPESDRGSLVSAHVPVVYGCSHGCTFCVIPFRRGVERSRPIGDIAREFRALAAQGVKEITLLGQIVDRYGKDLSDGPNLALLLRTVHDTAGIERIRFLTSHPTWMTDELLETVAELPKVCEHIEVPVQAGDDDVLRQMKRGYTVDDYRRLIERIRVKIPGVSIATDIIVGFPGESEAQFRRTYDLLSDLNLDVAHIAKYSPRPQTVAQRALQDDVFEEDKEHRRKSLEDLQARVVTGINRRYLGKTVEVLVEGEHNGKWRGRTRTNKLVFLEVDRDLKGRVAEATITWAGPWSMQGRVNQMRPATRTPDARVAQPL